MQAILRGALGFHYLLRFQIEFSLGMTGVLLSVDIAGQTITSYVGADKISAV
jgi:hypothetical protein